MTITLLTLFPEIFTPLLDYSIIGRALKKENFKLNLVNLRDFGIGKHLVVDDRPYGGGVGMVIRVDILKNAIKSVKTGIPNEKVVLLDPKGKTFDQMRAIKFSKLRHLILICGHYEGIDERVKSYVDEIISIGDFVLTGGEPAAISIIDAVVRLLPNVLTKKEATKEESFSKKLPLEYPQYTRPEVFEGKKVPKILLSGDHGAINKWRKAKSLEVAAKLRPDLLKIRGQNKTLPE